MVNFGKGGMNSAELLERMPEILTYRPALGIVMIGANDVVWQKKALPPEKFAQNLRGVIVGLLGSGANVILVTTPPCIDEVTVKREGSTHLNGAPPNVKIARLNRIVFCLAVEYHLALVDFWDIVVERGDFDGPTALLRNMANSQSLDGVHPTAEGYRLLAEALAATIYREKLSIARIACLGDSITFGVEMRGEGSVDGDTYPAQLRRLLA